MFWDFPKTGPLRYFAMNLLCKIRPAEDWSANQLDCIKTVTYKLDRAKLGSDTKRGGKLQTMASEVVCGR